MLHINNNAIKLTCNGIILELLPISKGMRWNCTLHPIHVFTGAVLIRKPSGKYFSFIRLQSMLSYVLPLNRKIKHKENSQE
jgi:hypothetical protein